MSTKRLLGVSLLAGLMLTASVSAQSEREERTIDGEGAERLIISGELAAGVFDFQVGEPDGVAQVEVEYDRRIVRPYIEYRTRGTTGYLDLEADFRRSRWDNDSENEWLVTLSRSIPCELDLEAGATESRFELGGLPLARLDLDLGASEAVISFDEPNPTRCSEISIDVGAASIELWQLGNANVEEVMIDAGASSILLDLTGEYTEPMYVDLEIGMGAAEILLPEGIPVRIEGDDDGWFSSVDIDDRDLRRTRSGYESEDYADAEVRILLRFEVGMGSIDVRFRANKQG